MAPLLLSQNPQPSSLTLVVVRVLILKTCSLNGCRLSLAYFPTTSSTSKVPKMCLCASPSSYTTPYLDASSCINMPAFVILLRISTHKKSEIDPKMLPAGGNGRHQREKHGPCNRAPWRHNMHDKNVQLYVETTDFSPLCSVKP